MKCRKKFLNKDRTIESQMYNRIYDKVQSEEADNIYRDEVMKLWKKTVDHPKNKYSEVGYPSQKEAYKAISDYPDLRPQYIGNIGGSFIVRYTNPAVSINETDVNTFGFSMENLSIQNNEYTGIFDMTQYQISDKDRRMYDAQLEQGYFTKTQKEVVERLLKKQSFISGMSNNKYSTVDGTLLERVSSVLKKEERYSFNKEDFDENDYKANREIGNQLDDAIAHAILNINLFKDKYNAYKRPNQEILLKIAEDIQNEARQRGEPVRVEKDVLIYAMTSFAGWISRNMKDHVLLSQQVVFNNKEGVAGATDLLAVDKNGVVKIIDVKSSINPIKYANGTFGNYNKRELDKNGNISETGTINKYNQSYLDNTKASKKERHEAQLSMYMGLLESMGFTVSSEQPLTIYPIHVTEVTNGLVTRVEKENEVPINILKRFREKYQIDTEIPEHTQKEYADIFAEKLDKLKIAIDEQIKVLRRDNSTSSRIEAAKLEEQLDELENAEEAVDTISRINAYADSLSRVLRGQKTENGYSPGVVQTLYTRLKSGDNPAEILREAILYRDQIMVHKDLAEEIENLMYDISRDEAGNAYSFEKSSIGNKLSGILSDFRNAEQVLKTGFVPLIADILWDSVSEDTKTSVDREISQLEKKLQFYKDNNYSERRINTIQKRIEKLKPQQIGSKDDLIKLLQGDYDDISSITSWVQSPSMMNNKVIQVYSNYLKSNLEKTRIQSIGVINQGQAEFERYKNAKGFSSNNRIFNEKIIERTTYSVINENDDWETKEVYAFKSDFDWKAYNEAYVNFYNSIKELEGEARAEAVAKWHEDNTEPIEKIEVEFEGNKAIVQNGYKEEIEIRKQYVKDKHWTQDEFDYWYQKNFEDGVPSAKTYNGRKMRQPKRSKYGVTHNMNEADKRYHSYLMYTYIKAQDYRGKTVKNLGERYHMPAISKKNLDRLKEQGLKEWAKKTGKGIYENIGSETEEIYGADGNTLKTIPAYFDNKIDVEDQSTDAILGILSYDKASRDYRVKAQMLPLSESLLQVMESNSPIKTSMGKRMLKSVGKRLNITTKAKYLESDANNVAKVISNMVDYHIYGEKKKKAIRGGIDINQLTGSLLGAMAFTSIGGPAAILTNVANILQGEVQNAIEASSLKYFDKKTLAKAQAEYTKQLANIAADNTRPAAKTFIGQLVEIYDPLIGRYGERYGKDISYSKLRKATKTHNWFWLQNAGEHKIHVTTMIATLMSTKVKQNGKEISLYDAYEQKDGKLSLKEGVELSDGLIDMNTKIKMDHINQSNHGVYNDFDIPELRRHWWGTLVEFFRKFVVSTMTKRYGNLIATEASGEVTEGFYRTFWNSLTTETSDLLKFSFGRKSNFTEMEKANLRRAYAEMMIVLVTGALISVLVAGFDDDDEEKTLAAASSIYLLTRLNSELSFYGGWGNPRTGFIFPAFQDIFRIAETPSLASTYIKKLVRIASQLSSNPFETYDRKYGWWDKGDSKLMARIVALLGVTPGKLDPEEAVKILELQRL